MSQFPGRRRTIIKNGRLKYIDEEEPIIVTPLKQVCALCQEELKNADDKKAHEINCNKRCRKCGKICRSKVGRISHERHCKGK